LSNQSHRTIVETERFTKAFEKLKLSYQRLDEALTGVHHALCVDPDKCPRIEGTKLSLIKTHPFRGTPALRIFFTYDANEVQLQHIEQIGGQQAPETAAAAK
jgi:hypothetical protein